MRKKSETIELTKEEKNKAIDHLKEFLLKEFDIEAGNLQTEILLDFITEKVGIYYYNRAMSDAIKFMTEKAEDLYLLMKDE